MNDENFEAEPEQDDPKEAKAPKQYYALKMGRRQQRLDGVLISHPAVTLATKTPPRIGVTIQITTEGGVTYEGKVSTAEKSSDGVVVTFKSGLNPA